MIKKNLFFIGTWTCILTWLCIKAYFLQYPDLLFSYPFITWDGFEYVCDSLLYLGYDLDFTFRNPGLPVVIAALTLIQKVHFLPFLLIILLLIFSIYLYILMRQFFSKNISLITLLCFFFNFSIQGFFDFVLADQWAITTILAAITHLVLSRKTFKHFILFAFFSAVSFQFQYAVGVLGPAFLFFILYGVFPSHARNKSFFKILSLSIIIFLSIIMPNLIYKWIQYGSPLHSKVIQFGLLKPGTINLFYYSINFFSFFGLITGSLIIFGIMLSFKKKCEYLFFHAMFLTFIFFWIVFYSWPDVRFLLYFVPIVPIYFSHVLHYITERYCLHSSRLNALKTFVFLMLALLFSLHNKTSPFEGRLLMITPWHEIFFDVKPILAIPYVNTLKPNMLALQKIDKSRRFFSFLTQYYPLHQKDMDLNGKMEKKNLTQIHKMALNLKGPNYTIAQTSHLTNAHHNTQLKIKYVLKRELKTTDIPADFILADKSDAQALPLLKEGPFYILYLSEATKASDST